MLLNDLQVRHLNTVTHDGKVLLFSTRADGKIRYTVKQEGFEPQYLATPSALRSGWEPWRDLELPADADDPSVLAQEKAENTLTSNPATYILRSRYNTINDSAVAPVQLISAMGHLYVFRQSKAGTLLCDRYVLNGETNTLVRKLEIRHKRSGQKFAPSAGFRDSLDFTDLDGNYFFEPTAELCLIKNLQDGWFSVVLVPTNEHEVYRWHIFAYNTESKQVELTTLSASEEGLFDVHDFMVFEPLSSVDPTLVPRVVAGIQRRGFSLGATVTNGLSAVRYDLQREGGAEKQLYKTATRVLLAVPTDRGTAALNFSIAADGMLSLISNDATTTLLRSTERDLLLPVSTLDGIRAISDLSPLPKGVITAMACGTAAMGAEDRVVVVSKEARYLASSDTVEMKGTTSYDGVYQVANVTPNSFEIAVKWTNSEIGFWQTHEKKESGLVFDGMITAYEKTLEGKLKVTAPSHLLENGDEVEIVGTRGYDGLLPVTKLNETQFVLDRPWPASETVNLKLLSRKRRGLLLDGLDDYVELPPDTIPEGKALTVSFWAKGGTSLPKSAVVLGAVGQSNEPLLQISVPDENGKVVFAMDSDGKSLDRLEKEAQPSEFKGQWVHWCFIRDAVKKEMKIFKNGLLWHSGPCKDKVLASALRARLGASAGASAAASFYQGELADLRIFGRVLGEDEVRRSMYLPLSGKEVGLSAYYRLNAIQEGTPPAVVDFSAFARQAEVLGGAFVGIVSLPRKLGDGSPAVKYTNKDMVAVEEQGTYIEEFEFRVNTSAPVSLASLNSFDGQGNKIFRMSCWGKNDRNSPSVTAIAVAQEPFSSTASNGFFRASGKFTVPAGVTLIRAFEISSVTGDFVSLEIRRHRIRKVEDAVTEVRYSDAPKLSALSDAYADIGRKIADLRLNEQKEAQLLLEQATIAERLDGLNRLEENRFRLDSLRAIVLALKENEQVLADDYNRQAASPFNYYCFLGNLGANATDQLQAVTKTRTTLQMAAPADIPAQKWRFRDAGNGTFFIENAFLGTGQRATVLPNDTSTVEMGASADVLAQKWKVAADGSGGYYIYNSEIGDGRRLQATKHGNVWDIELQSSGNDQRHHFTLKPTTESCTTAVADALAAWQAAKAELDRAQKELADLEAIVNAGEPQRIAWRTRLHQIIGELGQVQDNMTRVNMEITMGLKGMGRSSMVMPQVAEDSRGLLTSGAMLGFVQAASRLSALETCEGNVQLSYFDTSGRIRATNFDATADSRNSTFEEWIPDAQRACLHLSPNRGIVAFSPEIDLAPEHTLEAWVYFPLPPREWNVLTSDAEGREQSVVAWRGKTLGVRSEGFFFGTDVDVTTLSPGWHHLAAVQRTAGADISISFYVDGKPFGSPVKPSTASLLLDGLNDSISLPSAAIPAGAQISISFWARSNSSRESLVLQALDSLNLPVVAISLPTSNAGIGFDCGNDGKTADRIEKTALREEYRGEWSHFAFTKNASTGLMKIYRNGKLWHSETNKTKFLPATATAMVGRAVSDSKSSFEGQLADLRIWSRELSEDEVGALFGAPLPGLNNGLVARYRFDVAGSAADSSGLGHHGTIQGAPKLVGVSFHPGRLAYLGNAPNLSTVKSIGMPLIKRAARFDGVDDHIALPPMNIDPSQGLTLEMWVKFNSFKDGSRLADFGNGPNADNILLANKGTSSTLSFTIFQGNKPFTLDAPDVLEQGQWVHIAATIDAAGNAKIYKNGQPAASATLAVAAAMLRSQCFIGKNLAANQKQFDGQLAEVRLWSHARVQIELQESMYNRLTGREMGLLGYWPLDTLRTDLASGNILDLAGNASGTAANGINVSEDDSLPVSGLGASDLKDSCFGKVSEIRLWGIPLSDDEIATNGKLSPSGNEPGIAAYYPLNEGTGFEILDAARHNAPGTVKSRFAAAVLSLDGVNDCITVADNPNLRLSAYTVELWMKPNGVPNEPWKGILGKPGRNFNIWLNTAGYIHHRFHVGNQTNQGAPDTPAGSIKWHQWNHVAITNDGKTARTYINGKLLAEGPTGGVPTIDATALIIGKNLDGKPGHQFKGRLADIRLWNKARTQDEIQQQMTRPLSGQEEGLVACWPMSAITAVNGQRSLKDLTGKNQALVVECNTIADTTLPVQQHIHLLPDDSLWWGFTGVTGNLGHQTLAFDGVDDHLALPAMNVDYTKGITLEGWVKYNTFKSYARIFDLGNGAKSDNIVLGNEDKSGTLYFDIFKGAASTKLTSQNALALGQWIHIAATIDSAGNACLYKNGQLVQTGTVNLPNSLSRNQSYIGRSNWANDGYFDGQMADLRIWNKARSQAEIRMSMYERLTGNEAGLAAYWPMDRIVPGASGTLVEDRSVNAVHASISGPMIRADNLLPMGADALVSAEHRTADLNPVTQKPYLLMRRLYAYPMPEGANLYADKPIEELTIQWMCNAQFAPTLMGYIEGAPPVPSENLTESDDYNAATSVELSTSEDVEFRWNRSDEYGLGANLEVFLGANVEVSVGLGAYTKVLDLQVGVRGNLNFNKTSMHETSITTTSSSRMTDRLELRGTPEADPKFPHLGKRFIPKNVGYALVVSSVADVYAIRLARTGKMLGYQVRPVEGMPPEVNTITFLMNPAYTMQGSLDGMTGSQATSGRYMKDVPEMRAQFGSSYPSSFYRPNEARDLKEKIERWDKDREAYFEQYKITPGFPEFKEEESSGGSEYKFQRKPSSETNGWPQEMQTAWNDPNVESPPDSWSDDWVKKWNKEETKQQKEQAKEGQGERSEAAKGALDKLKDLGETVKKVITGQLGRLEWQKKMEEIQIAAGKRNIVNTYVWDADGGLRSESQSFASTAEHTIGGTFQLDASLGFEASVTAGGVSAQLTAMAQMSMTQTINKTETHTKGIEMLVDLSGMESIGITDYDDRPLLPGEKVDRYRFMSFYLEGSTDNYNDFFRTVVNPEWLRSSDEEAVMLRKAMGKPNKAWRILHRVTYVERPGALGLDATPRLTQEARPAQSATDRFDDLTYRTQALEGKLNEILSLLKESKAKP